VVYGLSKETLEYLPVSLPYSIYFDICLDNKKLSEAYCEQDILKILTYECPFGCYNGACETNIKDDSKYSSKQVFLISNQNWQDTLSLIPIAKWTEEITTVEYPMMIYNLTNANQIKDFLFSYNPSNIVVVGNSIIDNLILNVLSPDIPQSKFKRISSNDYFSYWTRFKGVVYVESDYNKALEAAEFASSINAPLIIQGSSLDNPNIFQNRYVICMGDVPSNKCNEYKNG
jgi:putative cell wall-binding protein